jgi:hypothetical protein
MGHANCHNAVTSVVTRVLVEGEDGMAEDAGMGSPFYGERVVNRIADR